MKEKLPLLLVVTVPLLQVSIETPDNPVPELFVTRPETVTLLHAESATHWLCAWQPDGLQVRVCNCWPLAQPPAAHPALDQAPQEQVLHVESVTHWLCAEQPEGLQVLVCWRWPPAQPPAAHAPLVQLPQEQATHDESLTHCDVDDPHPDG